MSRLVDELETAFTHFIEFSYGGISEETQDIMRESFYAGAGFALILEGNKLSTCRREMAQYLEAALAKRDEAKLQ